ncbi:MAG: thioredoxin-dependent thiol peroxidase [Rhodospirillales bacterium]|nr:thioredoxin-dependent thiol peroxidase [Rhodospirillales bacterium]
MVSMDVGDQIPPFDLPTDGGGRLTRDDFKGKQVVLYFYPKDDTSGCTKEARAFRDAIADFDAIQTMVVGVSKDSAAKHDKFKAKHDLTFPLISDEDGTLCEAFGVWVEKSMYGRKYMGIERATFLIDGDGTIRRVWRKVKVTGHVDQVLQVAKGE